ncbi:SOS response-associated peptidase [Chitinophaga barathri]|uniref:Abasic site processing protein n=1 Tax=Chitinophaga barathri TaxID=1647451 RepID=A0A3N4M9G3_9BACT|nr:SOS response-associated peptidase [Chitinophaga barathri]RPD40078.1 SOS response-associated peptidase [Chitinophaga barathri]
MCYDLSFSASVESIFDYVPELNNIGPLDMYFEPTFHKVAQAYPKWPVVLNDKGTLKLMKFEWGVIPNYMKTPEEIKKGRKWMVNARSEKVLDTKAYWSRIRKNRCLVAATGFFEHREIPGWKNKVPYYIRLKNRDMFFIAGLYTYSHLPNPETGELPGTFTVLTRDANDIMSRIHNGGDNAGRMPLILPAELEKEWLRPDLPDTDIQRILNYSLPSDEMEYWTVNSVRKAKPDDEGVIEKVAYADLPAL